MSSKYLLILLLILTTTSYSQTKRIEKKSLYFSSFVKTGYPNQTVTCSRLYVKLYLGRKRLVLHCDNVSLDLKLTKKKTAWRAVSKNGDRYTIFGLNLDGVPGMLFVPDDPRLLGVVLIDKDLCGIKENEIGL